MGNDVFGISVSALNSAQIGLTTTEHNIANANTPGFNRQEIVVGARQAQLTGAGYVGQGADVGTVKRVYDEFLSSQVIQQQGQAAQLNSYYSQIQQINNMLADPNAGLSPALQDFFSAVNGVSSAPNSMPARQTMLSSAQSLASRFQALNQQLVNINDSVNGQIRSSVTSINGYASEIATLNQSIVLAQAASGGKPPNDMLDQRDQLISQLNQEIKVNVTKQGDGSLNVTIGNGQLLVVGATSYGLQAVQSFSDPTKIEVAAGTASGAVIPLQQSSIQGGNLGGLIAFRSQTLDSAQNALGLVAMGVAASFNQQHQLGQDLNGAQGQDLFTNPLPVVNKNSANTGTAQVAASIADYKALTGSDYAMSYDGTNYFVTRLSDNTVTTSATLPMTLDGVNISLASGAPGIGDSFLIRPTVNGALSINVTTGDPAKIAAAVPIRTNATLTNSGTGTISAVTVNPAPPVTPDPLHPATDVNLKQAVTITFTSPTTFDVTGTGVGLPATGLAYTAGSNISYNGWTMQISGAPVAGDTFTVGPNTNASMDGSNALSLAGLQNQKTLYGGTTSYQDTYSQLVSTVGNKTRELKVTSTAQDALVQQTVQAQQSVSGVNLDEEAANLLRYQRAYQAAGKAMQIANTLFDTLLTIGR
ncbi:MAG: flagellar hook-associated protein FlgK [Nitrosomonadales bacterium]|nr:flagellar hook-associated protein FlgK [Nitrosomonadales bacterium]